MANPEILREGKRDFDFIVREANGYRSRDTGTITAPANSDIVAGTLVGVVGGSGAFAPYDAESEDGNETIAGILMQRVRAGTTAERTFILRDAEVNGKMLAYPEGADAAAIATANAGLAALGIIVR